MKLLSVACLFCFGIAFTVYAQQTQPFAVVQQDRQNYVMHEVQPGETWYRLGKIYHLDPTIIARANRMSIQDVLPAHLQLRIPLLVENFVQSPRIPSGNYTPVYHQVKPGETLYHISQLYSPATVESIKVWNHLSNNNIRVGQWLIVGYLYFDKQAMLATRIFSTHNEGDTHLHQAQTKVNMIDSSMLFRALPPRTASEGHIPPPLPAANSSLDTHSISSSTSLVSPLPTSNHLPSSAFPQETKATVVSPVSTSEPTSPFLDEYLQQQHQKGWRQAEIRGAGSWFSSNIPPTSKKYYVLFNEAPRGQVIQITNPLNGKSIYAKVLDDIPNLAENAQIIVKISDAAQKDLGITQDKFFCIVHYFRNDSLRSIGE
ncbi:MAG: LysM peptidoglycan-binding domain-containing protein [Thermoflavifilum sp.]|nr:LysM peptidoglycan-binding domain-containing protein [Thermoflavifilum sp.]